MHAESARCLSARPLSNARLSVTVAPNVGQQFPSERSAWKGQSTNLDLSAFFHERGLA